MKLTPITPSDTGWRALVLWDTVGNVTYGTIPPGLGTVGGLAGGIWIRRTRERVTLAISGALATSNTGTIDLPLGFYPRSSPYPTVAFRVSSGVAFANIGAGKVYIGWTAGDYIPSRTSAAYATTLTWDVFDTFPTMYPGLPA